MVTLMFLVKVIPAKKRELLLAVRGYDPESQPGYAGVKVFLSVDDFETVSCMIRWESEAHVEKYLASDQFHALCGAASTLGEHSEWHILRHLDRSDLALGDNRL
jgi:heme-degrading monooxygenase HmoA